MIKMQKRLKQWLKIQLTDFAWGAFFGIGIYLIIMFGLGAFAI